MKNCNLCGEPISTARRSDSKFCSNSCKAKYFELHGKAAKAKTIPSLAGLNLSLETKTITAQKVNEHSRHNKLNGVKKIEVKPLTPFKNLYQEQRDPAEQNTGETTINSLGISDASTAQNQPALPPQYITKAIQKSNPKYVELLSQIEKLDKDLTAINTEIKAIEERITQTLNDTGNVFIIAGALAGYGLGHFLQNNPKPLQKGKHQAKSKRTGKPTSESNFISKFIGAAIGAALGNVIKKLYKKGTTVSKAQALAHYKKKLQEVVVLKDQLEQSKTKINWQRFITDAHIVEFEEIPNPEYAKQKAEYTKAANELSPLSRTGSGVAGKFTPEVDQIKVVNANKIPDYDANSKIQRMKDVASVKRPSLNFTGKWLDFFGIPQTNFFCVIHGMSGEGKTNFSIQFAKYLAESFGNVVFVSGEEGFNPTFQQKIKVLGADSVPNLYAADLRTGEEILTEVQGEFHFIFIDSVNNMDIDPELMKEIRATYPQSAIIAICQSTKDGKMRGSYQLIHDADIAVKVVKGIAITTKNRFAETMKEFDVFEAYGKPRLSIVKGSKNRKGRDGNDNLVFRNTI